MLTFTQFASYLNLIYDIHSELQKDHKTITCYEVEHQIPTGEFDLFLFQTEYTIAVTDVGSEYLTGIVTHLSLEEAQCIMDNLSQLPDSASDKEIMEIVNALGCSEIKTHNTSQINP